MEPRNIIENYLDEYNDLGYATRSLIGWFSEDDIVEWFVRGYCAGDDHEIIEALGEENGRIVLDHYECHCIGK